MGSAILAFSSSTLAQEDWDFFELPYGLLHPDSLLFEDPFDDLLSLSALLNQLWIYLFKVQTLSPKSSNQSSSPALSSSSTSLYSSWMFSNILNRFLNWASSSSTVILFSLLSFNNVFLYALPFSVSFPVLVETSFTSFWSTSKILA